LGRTGKYENAPPPSAFRQEFVWDKRNLTSQGPQEAFGSFAGVIQNIQLYFIQRTVGFSQYEVWNLQIFLGMHQCKSTDRA
jgi:hypothetical protein